ncbi:hypothetical protein [Bradyrhizobium australiense]|uniref:NERD domain-containing protein n=1 Tax=Bradyrhizobium australiense TaxID=2721161 RepID=A0A7Y4GTI3_9BRAD|nr:hypothetical protein [Bradyrhizobium australiense]NOJ41052.1 hypothetical protein [Bradyrhizobium australiense]
MKRQKSRQKDKQRKPGQKPEGGFKLFRHPLSMLEPADVRTALLKLADRKTEEFPELIKTILQVFCERYPPHILAVMAGYGLTASVSDAGVEKRFVSKLEQHHLELLQALMLTLPLSEWGEQPASPADIQKTIDTIVDLAEAFHARRFKAVESTSDLQARTVLSLQERLRMHTQMVRNWGYFSEVVQISSELYTPLDEPFRKALGFAASDLIATGRHLVALLESRSTERLNRLRFAFREKTTARLVRAFFKHHPEMKGDAEKFLKAIPEGVTREQVAYRLLTHADIALVQVMNFTASEVAQRTGLSLDITRSVLSAVSLHPGDLSQQAPEHMFMANPVWRSPVIEIGGAYFCPAPQSLFSHIHDVMRSLAGEIGLSEDLERRRATYLEEKVKALLAQALPRAELCHGIKWRVDGVEYETDHVVAIDKTIVIVEDKSASLTGPGLRGAPDRVRRHVNDLVVAPSEQSERLEKMIWEAKAGKSEAVASLAPFGLNFDSTERVVRISVTLDDLSVLASAEGELKEAGWIPRPLMLAPTLNVADIQTAIDILGKPSFFLHYFAERGRFQRALRIFADEMDLLGCYLETGFNVGSLEKEVALVALTGMSAPVDKYYNSRDAGVTLRKPAPKLSPYFSDLIQAIESRAFPRWLTVTTDLLRSASPSEQKQVDRLLTKLKAKVERNWRDPEHECSLVISPPESRDTAVVFYAYPPQLASRRKEIAEELASTALEVSGRERCVMICRNTARWDEPYASIVIVNAFPSESDGSSSASGETKNQ